MPNQSINHAATAVESAAYIAVNVTGTIPQLGFIHEDPGHSFVLDIADLFRVRFTIPFAFRAVKKFESEKGKVPIERITRKLIGINLNKEKIIPQMIDRIKTLIEEK